MTHNKGDFSEERIIEAGKHLGMDISFRNTPDKTGISINDERVSYDDVMDVLSSEK